MKLVRPFLILTACLLVGCFATAPTKTAAPTPTRAAGAVPTAISTVESNRQTEVTLGQRQLATIRANVDSAREANTNQPAGPATTVVDKELHLAQQALPEADPVETAKAFERRAAVFAGRVAEATRLYKDAQSENDTLRSEIADAHAATEVALVSLKRAQAEHQVELERNRAANQAALDAANKRVEDERRKAAEEGHKLIVRCLIGLGVILLLAAAGIAVATNGMQIGKSVIAVIFSGIAFGLAQLVSHPWFNTVFAICVGIVVIGGGVGIWLERRGTISIKSATTELKDYGVVWETLKRVVTTLDKSGLVKDVEGKLTPLGVQLTSYLDGDHKDVIHEARFDANRKA